MQNKTMGVPAGRPLISSFRSGMSLSTFSRVIFHPPLAMLYELAPRDAAALERARALDPPTKTMFSMQLLRTAGYIAGLFELLERFGSGSKPASNFSFSSAIKRSKLNTAALLFCAFYYTTLKPILVKYIYKNISVRVKILESQANVTSHANPMFFHLRCYA